MADRALGTARAGRGLLGAAAVALACGALPLLSAAPAAALEPATKIAFITQPPVSVTAGEKFTVEVAVEDKAGEVVTSDDTNGVDIGPYAGPGQPQCASFSQTVVKGIATFSCSFEKAGTEYRFYAYSNVGSEDAFSNSFEVQAGSPVRLAFVTDDPRPTASRAHQFPVHVSVLDSYGNVVTSDDTDTVALALASGPGGKLECSPPSSATVSAGVAEFSCSIDQVGSGYVLKATSPTDAGLGSVESQLAIDEVPSLKESVVTISPNPAVLNANGAASFTVSVTVKDAEGHPIEGDEVGLDLTGVPNETVGIDPPSPQKTNEEGKVEYTVSCNEGYCLTSTVIGVSVVDETAGLTLASETEGMVRAYLFTPSGYDVGYSEESATILLEGAEPSKEVALSFDGTRVTPVGDCVTGLNGELSRLENAAACTFTVPHSYSVNEQVPVEITVGAHTYTVPFELIAPPSLELSPATGHAGTVITISGEGFEGDLGEPGVEPLKISFTPAPDTGKATASAECKTDGLGAILNNADTTCQITVPEGTTIGEAVIAAAGYPTATTPFNVKATCVAEPSQHGCTLEGISINSSNLVDSSEIYVSATTAVTIDAEYSDGSAGPLPAGGSAPSVKWSTEPQPSGAISLNGVSGGNQIGLTAKEVTSSPGVLEAQYEGFKATSDELSAVKKPCDKCFYVNSALLEVHAEVPGLSSTPVTGATANITQGLAAKGGVTSPPPCIPFKSGSAEGCGGGYPELPDSAAEACTTESAGECLLLAEEGTIEISTEVEDTITLTPPGHYTVTGVKGCHSVSGTSEAPVCHVLLPEWSEPFAITFELAPPATITAKVGGPEVPSEQVGPSLIWLNQLVDGAQVTITPTEGTIGETDHCEVQGGEKTNVVGGSQASCTEQLNPGTYAVSVGPKIALTEDLYGANAWVTSEDPQIVKLTAGQKAEPSFNTAYEPELTVNVEGPDVSSTFENQMVNGAVATITPVEGTTGAAVKCNVEHGEAGGKLAGCTEPLAPGHYSVSVEQAIPTGLDAEGNEVYVYITGEDPQHVELKLGERPSRTFKTVSEPTLTVYLEGPETSGPAWLNQLINGALVTITPTGGTSGKAITCEVQGGEESVSAKEPANTKGEPPLTKSGVPASCTKSLALGTYAVSLEPRFPITHGNITTFYIVKSQDPQPVEMKLGEPAAVVFDSAFEYSLANSGAGSTSTPSTPAQASDGPLAATASGGTGSVVVGQYSSDPVGAPAFQSSGSYFDVFLAPGATFTSLSFTDCELNGGSSVSWWNTTANDGHGEWQAASDETAPSGSPPCITVTINETTSPNLTQMTGTVFGVALSAATTQTTTTTTSTSTSSPPPQTAAAGKLSLDGTTIEVQSAGKAAVKLTCTGNAGCAGKLTLVAKTTAKKGKRKHVKTQTVATSSFSIQAGQTVTVKLALSGAGRKLLDAAHGHLGATLTISQTSPAPGSIQSMSVHLAQQKAKKAKR